MPATLRATLLLVSLALTAPALAKDGKLTGYDTLGRKGKKVTLKAKLEWKLAGSLTKDVEKETIDFFLVHENGRELKKARFVGTAETDDDGIATYAWKLKGGGQFGLEARVRKGRSEYVAVPGRLHVAVPPPSRPILLVQIDGTVSKATNLKLFKGTDNDEIEAVDNGKAMLKALAMHHQLVFLTDLEVGFSGKFKDWLELRGIPKAPILFWELFERSLSHAKYMKKLVEELKDKHPRIEGGIGGTQDDGEAFVENGLLGVVIGGELKKAPAEVIGADDWKEAFVHVLRYHQSKRWLEVLAKGKAPTASQALFALSLLGQPGIGYVHRFKGASDVNLAAAAGLVSGRLQAIETFAKSLDRSSANRVRNSLLAAWRYGERGVLRHLFDDPEDAKKGPMPAYVRLEEVSRNEPDAGKVVFKVRLTDAKGKTSERVIEATELDDKTWKVASVK